MNLNRNIKHNLENYQFINFTSLKDDMIDKIRVYRNHPDIRKVMYDAQEITTEQHHNFIINLNNRDDRFYWLVFKENIPIGVVNIVDVDIQRKEAESGYYLFPDYLDTGLGMEFTSKIHHFLFSRIGCRRLYGRIQLKNRNSLLMAFHMGFNMASSFKTINGEMYVDIEGVGHEFEKRYPNLLNSKEVLDSIRKFQKYYKKLLSWK